MTALPDAVVKRCARAMEVHGGVTYSEDARIALAEFLAIIEERGLRVVPRAMRPEMGSAMLDFAASAVGRDGARKLSGLEAGTAGCPWIERLWRAGHDAAPPLADLLEDTPDAD